MDNEKPLATKPVNVPTTEKHGISTSPLAPLVDSAEEEIFDSSEKPGVEKQFVSVPVPRPRGPRKSTTRTGTGDDTSSSQSNDSSIATSSSHTQSQEGSDDDGGEESRTRKTRPHSGVIKILEGISFDKLAKDYVAAKDKLNLLTKLKSNLEKKSEDDTAQIEALKDTLKTTKIAMNRLEPRTLKAEKELAELQDIYHEIVWKNAELEDANKELRREAGQVKKSEDKLREQNERVEIQLAELQESLHRKTKIIDQQRDDVVSLKKARDVILQEAADARQAQELLVARDHTIRKLADENSALRQEASAVRDQIKDFEQNQHRLAQEIWQYEEEAQLGPHAMSEASTQGSWNAMVDRQTSEGQELMFTSPLTNASTHSTTSIRTPQSLPGLTNHSASLDSKMDESEMILLPKTYVDTGTQPDPENGAENSKQADDVEIDRSEVLRPSTYVERGVQMDPEYVEVQDKVLPESATHELSATSRVKRSSLMNHVVGKSVSSSAEVAGEKRHSTFRLPSGKDAKSIDERTRSEPGDQAGKLIGLSEGASLEASIRPTESVVRDFAIQASMEDNQRVDAQELPTVRTLPIISQDQQLGGNFSSSSSSEGTTASSHSRDAARAETRQSFLAPPRDFVVRTGHVAGVATKASPTEKRPIPRITVSDHTSDIRGKPLERPIGEKDLEPRTRSFVNRPTSGAGLARPEKLLISRQSEDSMPFWWHAVLALMILVMLSHAFSQEQTFWRNANQLTREAVIRMRHDRWESAWMEQIGYEIGQKLSVDRTGFC